MIPTVALPSGTIAASVAAPWASVASIVAIPAIGSVTTAFVAGFSFLRASAVRAARRAIAVKSAFRFPLEVGVLVGGWSLL
jgi:hypothetical protein